MLTAQVLLVYLLQHASLFGLPGTVAAINPVEATCLAKNIYFESRGEDIQGQYAIASVTMNRVRELRFPDSVCGVVHQMSISRYTKKEVCAFSWYCDQNSNNIDFYHTDGKIKEKVVNEFQTASYIAVAILSGLVKDNTNGATNFCNTHISQPPWIYTMKKTKVIGNHSFFRLPPIAQNINFAR